jgi:hypothetical protein
MKCTATATAVSIALVVVVTVVGVLLITLMVTATGPVVVVPDLVRIQIELVPPAVVRAPDSVVPATTAIVVTVVEEL